MLKPLELVSRRPAVREESHGKKSCFCPRCRFLCDVSYDSPHDSSFCIGGSAGGLALWHKQSRLCTQSSVPGFSTSDPFLILHNFSVSLNKSLSFSLLPHWEVERISDFQSWRLLNPMLTGIIYVHYRMCSCEFYLFILIHVPVELHFTQDIQLL